MLDRFSQYQSNILFLLIGTNPLPNYVSGRVLAADGATIYLLHSTDTLKVAERLQRLLGRERPDLTIIPREIDEADGDEIVAKIGEILWDIGAEGERVGLNYSGGTKSMAVHAYYTLRKAFPKGCFSYLDARSLSMVIDPGDQPIQWVSIGQNLPVGIIDLLQLHGYHIPAKKRPIETPLQPKLCRAIAEVHTDVQGFSQWRDWMGTLADAPQLPKPDEYPALKPVKECFSELSGGVASEMAVANTLGCSSLISCAKFFNGGWLEHHSLFVLKSIASAVGLHDCVMSVNPEIRGIRAFDLDVAAMSGYQLFTVSCIATDQKDKAKEHLFEVFTHARQVGGDEARFGLVCCYDRPASLQREISEIWDAEGKIRVFGRADLLNLSDGFLEWFQTANQ